LLFFFADGVNFYFQIAIAAILNCEINGPALVKRFGDNSHLAKLLLTNVYALFYIGFNVFNNPAKVEYREQKIKTGTKFKKGKMKSVYSTVIEVHSKRVEYTENESDEEKEKRAEYSHRFKRRGHWRKCKGIGLGQDGVRDQIGRTWIYEQELGPPDKPLIEKVRHITDPPKFSETPPETPDP